MKLPNWPDSKDTNWKLGLDRIKLVLDKLGNPEKKLQNVFHVAGTNGKGSTTTFLKAIFEADGYKVNRFISPHLVEFNERIEIYGKPITDEHYNKLADELKKFVEENNLELSYFEAITVIAILAFSRSEANVNIIEVGLGGRLDSTNVFENPLVDIITTISYDHMSKLGNTLEEIAMEKFGIVRAGTPIIISKQQPEITDLLIREIEKIGSPYYAFGKQWKFLEIEDRCLFEGIFKMLCTPKPTMEGRHQIINAGNAIAAILAQNKVAISDEAIRNGLINAFWPARLQNLKNTNLGELLPVNYELWLDGAHNEDGARVVAEWVEDKDKEDKKETIAILEILERKDTRSYLNNLSKSIKKIILVNASNKEHKFKEVSELKKELKEYNIEFLADFDNITDALKYLKNKANGEPKRIVITGSLYFGGDVLSLVK